MWCDQWGRSYLGIVLTEVSRPLALQEGKILRVLKRLEEVDMTLDILQVDG